MEENGNHVVNQQVLNDFRNSWRQELQNSNQIQTERMSQEDEAANLFMQGVELERKGKCIEAMRLYRRAVQIDPDVEYKCFAKAREEARTSNESKQKPVRINLDDDNESDEIVDNLIEVFQKELSLHNKGVCESNFGAGTISTSRHISSLPVEVFLVILKWLVSNDLDFKSLERFSQVCKGFYLLSRDQEAWKLACIKIWGSNVSPSSTWREMYITRYRVNFNGCYISKINYQRYGENSFQDQFYRPLQLVEYFRLIRFLPNGKLLMMTSAEDLQLSVNKLKNVQSAIVSRDVLKGHYHYQDSTVLIVIKKQSTFQRFKRKTVNDEDELTFFLELEIDKTSTSKKRFTKLLWKHYAISQFRSGEEQNSEFDLRSSAKYPPFFFSHVKSYHLESYECLKV